MPQPTQGLCLVSQDHSKAQKGPAEARGLHIRAEQNLPCTPQPTPSI